MRVVDEDRRAVALADQLEPALRAFEAFERGEDVRRIAAGRDREARGDQRILDLERADQRQAHAIRLAVMLEPQRLREAVDRDIGEPDAGAVPADREHAQAALAPPPRRRAPHARHRPTTTAAPPSATMRSNRRSFAAR